MATTRRKRAAGRPVGDSQDIVRAVLGATVRQLGKHGFVGLSVEAVAREAGVNKTSVYRRWPTKADLVLATVQGLREEQPPFEETGELRGDLVRILQMKARAFVNPQAKQLGRALLVIDQGTEADALVRSLRERQDAVLFQILRHAIERGELPHDAPLAVWVELLLAPIVYRALVLDLLVDDAYVESLVAHFLCGIGPERPP